MPAAVQIAVRQGTPEWLEARRDGIGSSDAPVIAGERGSIIELWAEKTHRLDREPPDAETERLFDWGHRLEPVVAAWYTDETGRPLRHVNYLLRHPHVPYALASLDRVSARKGERRVVEIKTERWGWPKDEPIPGFVQAQVQHQLWVTGYDVADVVILTGGSQPRIVEVPRDDGYIADLAFVEAAFWDNVETGTMPAADGSETTRRALSRMHPYDDGSMLPANADLVSLAEQLRAARIAKKAADADEGTLANAIRAIVGDASGVEGVLTLRKNSDSTRTNWPGVAKGYRLLLEDLECEHLAQAMRDRALPSLDAVETAHSETVQGARVLRLLKESQP